MERATDEELEGAEVPLLPVLPRQLLREVVRGE